ncbi:MAG: glycoside hydrolase family 38 C-terminal domain-containing protein [Gemmatimonadales bacterium]
MTVVHLVSHTHWDREWYLPAARFRQRLVALVDELLDAPPASGASFLLDGQTAVIEDYLAVRPERAAELSALLQRGALEAGPWFVLADELIPGEEALVRNLLAGRRTMRAMRAVAPAVLYCPDSFGHPAAMPALARGFGYDVAVALRGFGSSRAPAGDAFWWLGPDHERVLLYHFARSGYEAAANLPAGADEARGRWKVLHEELVARSTLGAVLAMNGADHHARQERLDEAVTALAAAGRPDEVRASSLGAFVADLAGRSRGRRLPEISGELRDSYGFVWTLQGTFATRAYQKRRNARIERLLVRDAEPWVALAARGATLRRLVEAAWKSLLLCHPHDTLCGCSTDEVARAMDARLDEAASQAAGIRRDALFALIGHREEDARERRAEWKPMVVVRNAAARPRAGVAILRLTSFLSDVKVGANASPGPVESAPRTTPAVAGVAAMQVLARSVEHELTESPRHYPDDDLVSVTEVAAWVPEIPGYGVRCFAHAKRQNRGEVSNPVRVEGHRLTNGRVTVAVREDGRVLLDDAGSGRSIADLLAWDSAVDLGDLYTPSPRGAKFSPRFEGAKVVHRGPVRATIETRWSFRQGRERVDATVRLILDADARCLRFHVAGTNAARDHRLRLRLATDVRHPLVVADAMFGPVERRPIVVTEAEARFEQPLPTAPLHRYVSLFDAERGATLFSDGLAEYEVKDSGVVLVTLVRAVGELSRSDLPERPGNAGWPTPTPEAQCTGPFASELALLLHGPRSAAMVDEIERASDDILLPLTGSTLRSALHRPPPLSGVELHGEGLACSAVKESEDGTWLVLRCVNLLEEERAGTWRLGAPVTEVMLARLDETPLEALAISGNTIPFRAPRRGVVTVLAR